MRSKPLLKLVLLFFLIKYFFGIIHNLGLLAYTYGNTIFTQYDDSLASIVPRQLLRTTTTSLLIDTCIFIALLFLVNNKRIIARLLKWIDSE